MPGGVAAATRRRMAARRAPARPAARAASPGRPAPPTAGAWRASPVSARRVVGALVSPRRRASRAATVHSAQRGGRFPLQRLRTPGPAPAHPHRGRGTEPAGARVGNEPLRCACGGDGAAAGRCSAAVRRGLPSRRPWMGRAQRRRWRLPVRPRRRGRPTERTGAAARAGARVASRVCSRPPPPHPYPLPSRGRARGPLLRRRRRCGCSRRPRSAAGTGERRAWTAVAGPAVTAATASWCAVASVGADGLAARHWRRCCGGGGQTLLARPGWRPGGCLPDRVSRGGRPDACRPEGRPRRKRGSPRGDTSGTRAVLPVRRQRGSFSLLWARTGRVFGRRKREKGKEPLPPPSENSVIRAKHPRLSVVVPGSPHLLGQLLSLLLCVCSFPADCTSSARRRDRGRVDRTVAFDEFAVIRYPKSKAVPMNFSVN